MTSVAPGSKVVLCFYLVSYNPLKGLSMASYAGQSRDGG